MAGGSYSPLPSLVHSSSSRRGVLRERLTAGTVLLSCMLLAVVGLAGLAAIPLVLSGPPSAALTAVVGGTLPSFRGTKYPLVGEVRKAVSEVGPPPPAFDGYGELQSGSGPSCVVSDTYRFIYFSMQKASSTTIRVYLINALCGSGKAAAKPNSNCTLPLLNFRQTPMHYERCSDVPRAKFAAYYSFTFTRNVWARAVSSYTYCRQRDAINASWAEWCADPDLDRACSHVAGNVEPTFEPSRPRVRGTDEHWAQQQPRLCTEEGDCWVDYVGPSEDIGEHFPAVIAAINERRPVALPALPPFVNKVLNRLPNSTETTPADWYTSRKGMSAARLAYLDEAGVQMAPACREDVGRYYAKDVEAFGQKFEDILPGAAA
ncbi:hypothetical protein I4F81_010810 [Pyropia yezoensis]|uniref:Uncharacterized protein n=1 Tax=Pyropia yezoensis TaxID=2788 RepID=A0ACC3CDI6_PYRYE|nr:hypothetical protein I4F81_010810 [Neopyropia yezoensis]